MAVNHFCCKGLTAMGAMTRIETQGFLLRIMWLGLLGFTQLRVAIVIQPRPECIVVVARGGLRETIKDLVRRIGILMFFF
jgi:hypothetical protein